MAGAVAVVAVVAVTVPALLRTVPSPGRRRPRRRPASGSSKEPRTSSCRPALRHALKIDFAKSRDNNLGDVSRVLAQNIAALRAGSALRGADLLGSASDTAKATADTAEAGLSNAIRERQDTLTGILQQGAGETDTLRAMVMAARNWHENASENNRSYFDSIRSINSGITDLNVHQERAHRDLHERGGRARSDLAELLRPAQ